MSAISKVRSNPTMRIALVSDQESINNDFDMDPLLEALHESGAAPAVRYWDSPTVDWNDFDVVLIRSPWTYVHRLDDFMAWYRRVRNSGVIHFNPLEVSQWSLDKRYLLDLAADGISTIPTFAVATGPDSRAYEGAVSQIRSSSERLVIKPSVGANSSGVRSFQIKDSSEAEDYVRELHMHSGCVLVQPHMASVEARGETDLVFFNGKFSHSIKKESLLGPDGRAGASTQDVRTTRAATDAEIALASEVLGAVEARFGLDEPLLYARVDLVHDPDGDPLLHELELCEPSLNLNFSPGSAREFAAAITSRVL